MKLPLLITTLTTMPNNKIPYLIILFLVIISLLTLPATVSLRNTLTAVLAGHDENDVTTLVFTGDVMLGRSVNSRLSRTQDFSWPFYYIGEYLREADLTYVNLESPLLSSCPLTDTGMKLCGDINNVAALTSAGVDVASLANNHALDYGIEGLKNTKSLLINNGIAVTGVGEPVVSEVNGLKIAFISFNDVNHLVGIDHPNLMPDLMTKANNTADLVVTTFHWGREYEAHPTSRQVALAHQAIDLGADLVVGAHPHWIQSKEVYQGVPIYYSLGNTIFDQEWSEQTKTGLVLKVYIQDRTIKHTEERVLYSRNYGQPRWQ